MAEQFASTKPATRFDWFDENVDAQRETGATNSQNYIEYLFSGFKASDNVTFNFVFGRSSDKIRVINFYQVGSDGMLLDDVNTASTGIYVTTTVTGATSYAFRAEKAASNSYPASVVNAMQITVPEPVTMSLLALGGIATLLRRRRNDA